MTLSVRHVISRNGRLPVDPAAAPISGVVGSAANLAREQVRLGRSVEIWGWNGDEPGREALWESVRVRTSRHWRWARFGRWNLEWLMPLEVRALRGPAVDVLHAHVDPNLLYLPRGRVRVLHLHTPIPDPFPDAYKRLLRRADAVVCCSEFIRGRFLRASGHDPDSTLVIHNGADLRRFDDADGRAMRSEWGFDGEDVVVLFAGAIVPEKGLLPLIHAFARVQELMPRTWLVVVGSAQLWASPGAMEGAARYEEETRRAADGLNVRFLGRLPSGSMPSAYRASDVVAVPSIWDDPHPTVVCEAMAAGRPIVASRAGGITETVLEGTTGYLVTPGDERALAEALVALAGDSLLRDRMGHQGRDRANDFTWRTSALRLDDIYARLLDRYRDVATG